jgi:hypothetical protein
MNKPINTELLNEKILKSKDIHQFIQQNENNIKADSFADQLYLHIQQQNLKNTTFFAQSGLSESYGYQLLNGKRQPSRDKILQCALGLSLSVSEVNRLLKLAEKSELYVKNIRDAIIIFSLNQKKTLIDANTYLQEEGCDILE